MFRGGVRRRARPFQEGDFPGPVKYGYLNVGAVEQGPPELRGRTVFCLYPHQTAYVVPAARGDRRARRRAARARRARRHGRDRRQRAVGRGAAGRRPRRGRRRRDGRLLRRAPARPVPGGGGDARRRRRVARRRSRPRSASASRGRTTPPAAATSSCTRARPSAGLQRSLELLAPEGTVLDLSWYGDAEVRLSLGGAFHAGRLRHPRQPGRDGVPGPQRAPDDGRPAGARARPAARPRVRRAGDRRVALRRAARRHGAAGRGEPAGALPHRSPTTGRSPCSASRSATT